MNATRRDRPLPRCLQWGTWPLLFVLNLGTALTAIGRGWDYSATMSALLAFNVLAVMALEYLFPLKEGWKMTRRSFHRDLKYLAAGAATVAVVNAAFGLVAIRLTDGHSGPIRGWPLYIAVPITLLVLDSLNYWQHRLSHEWDSKLGRFLWRTHVAHHLPDRVYLLMHVAAHPINGFIVRGFASLLPMYLLGADAETILVANAIIVLQGLVSHCNVDLRAGWFNYLFVGTELHRYHHSADLAESKNYAATLSIIDMAFGTFVYRPGRVPERLGVSQPGDYPASEEFWKVMLLPFVRPASADAGDGGPGNAGAGAAAGRVGEHGYAVVHHPMPRHAHVRDAHRARARAGA